MSKSIVLAGNQNCGKSSLFNKMMGAAVSRTANFPGMSVTRIDGYVSSQDLKVTDLPGIYSLSPYSPEEIVTRNVLFEGGYDAIVNVVDATHLERSFSLTAELLQYHRPMVIAVNMMDRARKEGIKLDIEALEKAFGVPVVPISAVTGEGIQDLYKAIDAARIPHVKVLNEKVESAVNSISALIAEHSNDQNFTADRFDFTSLSLLQHDPVCLQEFEGCDSLLNSVNKVKAQLEEIFKSDMESLIAQQRYAFVDGVVKACVKKGQRKLDVFSDRLDAIVTNRFLGLPIFFGILWFVYYLAVSTIGTMATDYANDVIFGEWATNGATALMESIQAPEWLSGLVVDGIIGGVGAVLGFVPQMIVLFFLLSILEQSGYMVRVAFVFDRLLRKLKLSGASILPYCISLGCAVPSIMSCSQASMDNINERRLTILTTAFVPCSAKLPIIAMIAAAFFPESTLVAPSVYFLAIFSIIFTALVLKKFSDFNEEVSPFVMEMPNYSLPTASNVLKSVASRAYAFIKKAGTVILATVIVIWFLSSFGFTPEGLAMVDVNDSMLAAVGTAIAFIFAPLGFGTWQAAVAVITGLLAKENVVGTLAVLTGLGDEVAEDDPGFASALDGVFANSTAAYAYLAFALFTPPCVAAIGAMKRQLNSGRIFASALAYYLVYAYAFSLILYAIGGLIMGTVPFGPTTIVAGALILFGLFLVFRPARKNRPALIIPSRQI